MKHIARAEGRTIRTATAHAPAITFLRHAGLFAAVMALIAGIIGMHVMTDAHAMHSPATPAGSVSAVHGPSPAGHTTEHLTGPSSAPEMPTAPDEARARTAQCTVSHNCTSMQSMTAACIPSAKTGSLAAPLPGTAIIAWSTSTGTSSAIGAVWSYLPGSPSPGELCISRT